MNGFVGFEASGDGTDTGDNTTSTTQPIDVTTVSSEKVKTNEIILFTIFGVFAASSIGLVIYGVLIRNSFMVISFVVCTISLRK